MQSFRTAAGLLAAVTLFALSALADNTTQTLGTLPAGQTTTITNTTATTTTIKGAPAFYGNAGSATTYTRADAQPDTSVLQQMQAGNIVYVTGGIGDEERNALDAAKNDYNLHIVNASKDGAFKGDTQVTIRDAKGAELMTVPVGPITLAKVPPGRYTIEATSSGETKSEKLTVGRTKAAHAHFTW